MTDEYLDSFLLTLIQRDGQALKEQHLLRADEIGRTDNDFDASIRFLVEEQLVTQERVGYDYLLTVTGKGKRFIQEGGFKAKTQRKNAAVEANRIARSAKTIAIWAIIISTLVALAVCYIELVYKNS